jgi:hypothetical protein
MLRAFLSSDEGSETRALLEQSVKRALQRGLEGAVKDGASQPPLPPDVIAAIIATARKWGTILAFAFAIAAPIVQQVAGLLADFARPNQVVTDQLAEIRAAQVEADERDAKQEQLLRDSIAWMIDANRALASDAPMPKVPASLNLAKAQAEAAQDQ